jgi:hypothetical protein
VQRTLIRKTSLLRKIEPIARRSGFANRIIYNPHLLQTLVRNRRERRNDPEIVKDAHGISMRPNSDRSPLYDVRKHAVHVRLNDACELMFRGRIKRGPFTSPATPRLRRGSLRCQLAEPKLASASEGWWSQTGSNRRPHACKARALPAELWPRNQKTNATGLSLGRHMRSMKWWAWEDLNFRPHAYQARALTN